MAGIGLKNFKYAKLNSDGETYGTVKTLAGAIECKVTLYVGFGHIVPKMVGGIKKYKVEFFPKVKFKPFIADSKTKGDSLEFTTPSATATIFENDNGDWEKHRVYDTETEANTALTGFFVGSESQI